MGDSSANAGPPRRRIYLDHAATSWPKAPAVVEAVTAYMRDCGAPAGRSGYREAIEVDRRIAALRRELARRIGAEGPDRIVFGFNGTDVLNLVLHGWLRPGDHVVATDAEHNSVLRPLAWLAARRGVEVDYAPTDGTGAVDPDEFAKRLRPGRTRLAAIVHASNVTGAIQPVAAVARAAHAAGARLLVDAAQSLGQWPLSVADGPIDFLAAPTHKSLGGPLGGGLLYLAPGLEAELEPLRQGGTGTQSEDERQPTETPERYEAGNLNVPALVGLAAALEDPATLDAAQLQAHCRLLTARALDGLRELPTATVYGPADAAGRAGVVSFNLEGFDPQELALTLDAVFGVQVRAGLHCAPRQHRTLGTLQRGGAVRMSWGGSTTVEMVDEALAAIAELASSV